MNKIKIQEQLEQRLIYGLSCEWEQALWVLSKFHRQLLKKPVFSLKNMENRIGCWSAEKREISLSRDFVLNHSWDDVVEVLKHEIAHQFTHEVLKAKNEKPHGPSFQKACQLLRANPKASGSFQPLSQRVYNEIPNQEDRILLKVKKLMALAQSKNQHEAEAAMLKAHELITRHNIDLLNQKINQNYVSVFIGKPALRHFREEYVLNRLIQDFYFVQGVWVSAFVKDKGKMGRVMEISGTKQNIQIAAYVHDYIKHYIDFQWELYNKDKKLNRYRKTDFATGIINGFSSKLESQEKQRIKADAKRALVKIKDPGLKNYMDYQYPYITSFRKNRLQQDQNVLDDGISIGRKLVIAKGISETGERGKFLPEK
ncbi:SprT-like domain-containing protein, DUF2786 [Desulfonema limicola]|uniref:SprT-like domain-containing protein, DUF2786 n=1 Tax=Desulfonema limicola TaxID=45656 RepID=A0A975GHK0_9BACT|nr:DUF2786 domain-containing protein [Desulfonema limicola]QTA81492.1 SprT-like domain-containing protein, DUF2786 [Desulfonema limicola]